MWRADSLENTLMLGGIRARGEGDDREWDGWMASPIRHESEWTLGVGDGQGGLPCCDSWGRKQSDTTEWLNWTEWMLSEPGTHLGISRGETNCITLPLQVQSLTEMRDSSCFSFFPSCHLKFSCQERWQGWHYNCNDNKIGQRLLAFCKDSTLQLSSQTAVRGPMAPLQTQQRSWSCAMSFGKLHPEVNSRKCINSGHRLLIQVCRLFKVSTLCKAHTNIFQIKERSLSPFTLPTGIFKIRQQS